MILALWFHIFPNNHVTSSNPSKACVRVYSCMYVCVLFSLLKSCVSVWCVGFLFFTILEILGISMRLYVCVRLLSMISSVFLNPCLTQTPKHYNTFIFKGQYRSLTQARFLNTFPLLWVYKSHTKLQQCAWGRKNFASVCGPLRFHIIKPKCKPWKCACEVRVQQSAGGACFN